MTTNSALGTLLDLRRPGLARIAHASGMILLCIAALRCTSEAPRTQPPTLGPTLHNEVKISPPNHQDAVPPKIGLPGAGYP
jgi:hypothetical protein